MDVNNFAEMQIFLSKFIDLAPSTTTITQTDSSKEPPKEQQEIQSTAIDPRVQKMLAEIEWFVDPIHKKDINFTMFKHILNKIKFLFTDIHVQFRHASGSGESCRIERNIPNETTKNQVICYSFHEMHAAKKGASAAYDPGRANDLQQTMEKINNFLFKPVV
jgi:hypothetical protein